jgi:hypothetical protein
MGVVNGLSDNDLIAIANGEKVREDIVVLATASGEWRYLRVEAREQVCIQLGARREMLRRQISDCVNAAAPVPDIEAQHVLQSFGVANEILDEAKAIEISESDWSFYGNRTMEFFVRHWNQIPRENRAEQIKILAILMKVADGGVPETALKSRFAEMEVLSAIVQQLTDREVDVNSRPPIPKAVQREVWRRDQGKCVDCGSQVNLEFDHIIPFSKGGSTTVRNIQLLCESCNRTKQDDI